MVETTIGDKSLRAEARRIMGSLGENQLAEYRARDVLWTGGYDCFHLELHIPKVREDLPKPIDLDIEDIFCANLVVPEGRLEAAVVAVDRFCDWLDGEAAAGRLTLDKRALAELDLDAESKLQIRKLREHEDDWIGGRDLFEIALVISDGAGVDGDGGGCFSLVLRNFVAPPGAIEGAIAALDRFGERLRDALTRGDDVSDVWPVPPEAETVADVPAAAARE